MNIVKIKFGLVLLLFLALISGLAAQDFIPTAAIDAGNGGYFGNIQMLEREKLMPHHIAAIKKNGVSLEVLTSKEGETTYFYYSNEGLLERSSSARYQYDDKDRLVSIEQISYDSESRILEFIRDSSGKITSIKKGDAVLTYKYSNGVLQQIGDIDPWKGYFQKEKTSHSYKYVFSQIIGTFDRFGREVSLEMEMCESNNIFDKNGRWTGTKTTCADPMGKTYPRYLTISYKNGLMKSINDNGKITTIKYEYGHKSKK